MRRMLFWGTTVALLAAAVHIITAVVAPRIERQSTLEELVASAPVNQLTVVEPKLRGAFALKGLAQDLTIAVCPFDVSQSALTITAPLPGTYWSISIFGMGGQNIYTINDKQVGTDKFAATIVRESTEAEGTDESGIRQGEGIIIKSTSEKGIVLLRIFVSDLASSKRVQDLISETACTQQS